MIKGRQFAFFHSSKLSCKKERFFYKKEIAISHFSSLEKTELYMTFDKKIENIERKNIF